MKTSLDHLPILKQHELDQAVEIIRAETLAEMIILFGSYARGDWVEDLDPETLNYRYQSDFDLLVITEIRSEAKKIESSRLRRLLTKSIERTPISLIAEDIAFLNNRLRMGHYFYTDIRREGILLYTSGKLTLTEPKALSIEERKKLAQENFDFWFKNATDFLIDFQRAMDRASYSKAAFYLHQATECFYSTILLVFTHYKPKTHDLEKLRQRVDCLDPQFLTVFPQSTTEEKARFELLRLAYVDARYEPSYEITAEELTWLADRVTDLQALTEKLCAEKIESFK